MIIPAGTWNQLLGEALSEPQLLECWNPHHSLPFSTGPNSLPARGFPST